MEYSMVGNTSSADKQRYGEFWTNAGTLFGAVGLAVGLAVDTGLNLEDPAVHNGLTGQMLVKDQHFHANVIPVVPFGDDGTRNPYQQIEITVKNSAGTVVASTKAMVPTSDEINCAKCHGSGDVDSAFDDLLAKHDSLSGTTLSASTPVLCASCHGQMSAVAQSIATDGRIPWAMEPTCGSCHAASATPTRTEASLGTVSTIAQVDTGAALYRNGAGHENSHGAGFAEFFGEHGRGEAGQTSACKVCHTGFARTASAASAPYQFQWRSR